MKIVFNKEDIKFWKEKVGYTNKDIKKLREELQELIDEHVRENVIDAGM